MYAIMYACECKKVSTVRIHYDVFKDKLNLVSIENGNTVAEGPRLIRPRHFRPNNKQIK